MIAGGRAEIHRVACGPHEGDGALPYPIAAPQRFEPSHRLSRGVIQRVKKRLAVEQRAAESIAAANELAGYSTPTLPVQSMSLAARASWQRAVDLHTQAGQPLDVGNSKEALRELLGASPSSYSCETTTVRPYAKQLVSWPEVGNQPRALSARLSGRLRSYLE